MMKKAGAGFAKHHNSRLNPRHAAPRGEAAQSSTDALQHTHSPQSLCSPCDRHHPQILWPKLTANPDQSPFLQGLTVFSFCSQQTSWSATSS